MQVEVGSIFDGRVTGITNFGAFVEFGEGKNTGLVHISEVASEYVKNINEHLTVNDKVTVKVVSVDTKGKIGLSIKQAIAKKEAPPRTKRPMGIDWSAKKPEDTTPLSFEDKLSKFKQASEEKMHDLKKSMDVKRGRRNSY